MIHATIKTIPAIVGAAKWLWKANPKAATAVGIAITTGVATAIQSGVKVVKKVLKK